jgi:hypothetical protein
MTVGIAGPEDDDEIMSARTTGRPDDRTTGRAEVA